MTTTLTSASVLLTSTSMTDVYQAVASGSGGLGAQCFNLVVTNYDGTNSATATLVRTDSSNTILSYLNPSVEPIPATGGQTVADYLILQPGQKIRAQASAANRISVDVSVREES